MKLRLSIAVGSAPPTSFEHAGPRVHIGRDPDCELPLEGEASSAVSRRHALIELAGDGATISDLGSSNGTLLNGQLLDAPAPLRVGDRIQMGYTGATLTVLDLDLSPAPAPAVRPPRPPSAPAPVAEAPAPGSRVVLIGAAAAGALLLAVAAVVAVVVVRRPKEESSDLAKAQPTESRGNPQRPVPTHPAPPPPPPDTKRDAGKPGGQQPPVLELPKGAPSGEVKEVASYIVPDPRVSLLLQRPGEAFPWAVLRPEQRVPTSQTLVSLPGYRSLLVMGGGKGLAGTHLTLWGNLPEFSALPVLESVAMLHAPAAGTDLEFTLDRGRVVIANHKEPAGPARVRLRVLQEAWDLDLPDDKSEVAVELWGELWGPPPRGGAVGQAQALTKLGLFTKGHATLKTPHGSFDLADRSRLSWQSLEREKFYQTTLPELPVWWTRPPDSTVPEVQKALLSLLDWNKLLGGPVVGPGARPARPAGNEDVVSTIRKQVLEGNDYDNQDVGVFFLAALDTEGVQVGPLITNFLMNRQVEHPNVRGTALRAVQAWLGQGGRHSEELVEILRKQGGLAVEKAKLAVGLLRFFTPGSEKKAETYGELVNLLADDELLVRVLAYWHLEELGENGYLPEAVKMIVYDPAWPVTDERHQKAIAQWKKLLAEGKLPKPRR